MTRGVEELFLLAMKDEVSPKCLHLDCQRLLRLLLEAKGMSMRRGVTAADLFDMDCTLGGQRANSGGPRLRRKLRTDSERFRRRRLVVL